MKYGIIDIGSNSVRLLVSDGRKKLYKKINTTQLGQGLAISGRLKEQNMLQTANAVIEFAREAKEEGCGEIYAFATEAVRSAINRDEFLAILSAKGIVVDVLDSKDEATIGFRGAYTNGKCCVLDIGGASTEIAVGDEKGLVYAKSMPIGLARIFDNCKENLAKIDEYINDIIKGYGQIPEFDELLAIGGTPATFVAMNENMTVYRPEIVDNYKLTLSCVEEWTAKIRSLDMEERLEINGLEPKRRNLIVGGGRLLAAIMRMLGRDCLTVRESDNLEGYLVALGEKAL
ncbi:MAG: hypothetical protein K2G37_03900 [Clostridia bacterium]|nr:hypothetical protein [Clostridia bacterium]MDE7328244.1 hypothetical protein [Clostridia bacterium]